MRPRFLKRITTCGMLLLFMGSPGKIPTVAAESTSEPTQVRITSSLDTDWRFLKGDAAGAEKPDFDDASWRKVNVPHDWSIEGPFDKNSPTGAVGIASNSRCAPAINGDECLSTSMV